MRSVPGECLTLMLGSEDFSNEAEDGTIVSRYKTGDPSMLPKDSTRADVAASRRAHLLGRS